MIQNRNYATGLDLSLDHDAAIGVVTSALKDNGFGVLTTIDMQATMKAKLGEDIAPYTLLGACHPGSAHKLLQGDDAAGVLLPCGVAVMGTGEGTSRVWIPRVDTMFGMIGREDLKPVADDVEARLSAVADSLSAAHAIGG